MSDIQLDEIEIAGALKDALNLDDKLNHSVFVLDKSDRNKDVKVGWCQYLDNKNINLLFTMNLPDVFIIASNGEPEKVAEILALISEYNDFESVLSIGDTCVIDNTYMKDNGYYACFISPVAISEYYSGVDNITDILGQTINIKAMFLIDEKEYIFKKKHGAKKMIDLFIENNRNIIEV